MCGGGWRKSLCVMIVVYVTFRLGSATCNSQCKSHARVDVVSVGLYDNTVASQVSGHNRTIR